jgi:hypothetical protein
MTTYSFKKEVQAYIVYLGNQYSIDLKDISFGQNFTAKDYETNTLHQNNYFAQVAQIRVKPANFTFTFPALREADLAVAFERGLDYQTFDLWITTQQDVFKIEMCVVTNMRFLVTKYSILYVEITGQASKLTREGDFGVVTVPGTVIDRSNTKTYNINRYVTALLNGVDNFDRFVEFSAELQNQVRWTAFNTIPETCGGTPGVEYPTNFALEKRILAGTFSINTVTDFVFDNDTTLYLEAGEQVSGTLYGFTFNLSNISFTSRINTSNIFTHNYDWRLTQNPDSLAEIITYHTLAVGASNAILDHTGADILDHTGAAILESP